MRNPVVTPLWNKRIRHGAVPIGSAPPTGSLVWIWSGIIAVPTLTNFPDQFVTAPGGIAFSLTMTIGTLDPPAEVGGSTYPYTIDLMIGASVASTLVIQSNAAVPSSTVSFAVNAMTTTTPVHPRIYAQPWGGAYDLTITLAYTYADLS